MDLDVVNMFVITGGMLAIPILAFVALFFLWPSVLIKIYYRYRRRALGMQVHYVRLKDYQFCYSFRGKPGHKPSILMLHEFSRRKDMWLCLIKFLPKNLHLVCVDMPGHGGTTCSSLDDLSIEGQVKRIHQVVDVSGADILAKSITTAKWKFWKTVGIQWWWRDPGSQLSSSSTF
uniref:acylglycerol lipase n=1 Tax=Rousettus aegyptiacus TaxID=9407 RepID=A0A7J8HL25_ROUAE|nr:hypothetical protein HJG63_000094 [Rousettus aegyptiacus]